MTGLAQPLSSSAQGAHLLGLACCLGLIPRAWFCLLPPSPPCFPNPGRGSEGELSRVEIHLNFLKKPKPHPEPFRQSRPHPCKAPRRCCWSRSWSAPFQAPFAVSEHGPSLQTPRRLLQPAGGGRSPAGLGPRRQLPRESPGPERILDLGSRDLAGGLGCPAPSHQGAHIDPGWLKGGVWDTLLSLGSPTAPRSRQVLAVVVGRAVPSCPHSP